MTTLFRITATVLIVLGLAACQKVSVDSSVAERATGAEAHGGFYGGYSGSVGGGR